MNTSLRIATLADEPLEEFEKGPKSMGGVNVILIDCPRSDPGPVRPLFADPRPGPQVQVQQTPDLDPRSGLGPQYCSVIIFVINIHIYIIIQKSHLSHLCSPK